MGLGRSGAARALFLTRSITSGAQPPGEACPRPAPNLDEAAKLVGYRSSVANLRWLFGGDTTGDLSVQLRRLIGSEHPLVGTVRSLVRDEAKSSRVRELMLLLLAEAAKRREEKPLSVLHGQRTLAEVAEMIRIGRSIRGSVVNLEDDANEAIFNTSRMRLSIGNKVATLGEEFILRRISMKLSSLGNEDLEKLISTAILDQAKADSIGERDSQNNPLPSRNIVNGVPPVQEYTEPRSIDSYLGYVIPEWTAHHEMSEGTLLGKCCQGALMMADLPEEMQQLGYAFGVHAALVCKASAELEVFSGYYTGPFSLISAPVLFLLADRPELYNLLEARNVYKIDYSLLHKEVSASSGIEQTKELRRRHADIALQILEAFPDNEANNALCNVILAMQDS